ncbi:MAG: glycosyltransferase family 4 protein [Candidatus Aenigmatarchaeota archaeon]
MTRILFVLDFFTPHVGGAETLFDNMTKKLADKGIEIDIITQKIKGSPDFESDGNRRIHRVYSPFRHSFALAAAGKCVELSKKSDIVHAATLGGLGTVMTIEKFINKPVVATFFEVWDRLFLRLQKPPMSLINYSLENLSLRHYRNHVSTAISNATKQRLLDFGFDAKKTHVVYPGIDRKLFNPKTKAQIKKDYPLILFFGRPGVAKGINYLISAMKTVTNRIPEAKLMLLLSRNPASEYRKSMNLIKTLDLQDSIDVFDPKPLPELPGIIKSADVCVVPSISEGFGFSAAESLSCGTPVVASAAGSLPEIVKNGFNGLLSEPGSPDSISGNVIKILSDKKLRSRLAKNAPNSVKKFDWDKGTKEYIKIYENVLHKQR